MTGRPAEPQRAATAAALSDPGPGAKPDAPQGLPRPGGGGTSPDRPLEGLRVLVPRPAGRAGELVDLLRRRGAEPWHVPLIGVTPLTQSPQLREAVGALAAGGYDWVALTSAAAIAALRDTAGEMGVTLSVDRRTRVAVVGAATARAAQAAGLRVDLMPPAPGSGAALAAAWPAGESGATVLLPRSDQAAADLPDALRAAGLRVVEVCAYRTEAVPVPGDVQSALRDGDVAAVLLTSPSTARALATIGAAPGTLLVAIGEPTAAAMRAGRLPVHAIAAEPSAAGLVAALLRAARAGGADGAPSTAPLAARRAAQRAFPRTARRTPSGDTPSGDTSASASPPRSDDRDDATAAPTRRITPPNEGSD